MTMTLDHRPAPPLTPFERRNSDRRDRVALALSELFGARGDLDGVSGVADVLAEDLRWSA
jgi:hypothetical protein